MIIEILVPTYLKWFLNYNTRKNNYTDDIQKVSKDEIEFQTD